jgi:hypothetical protein
VFGRKTIGEVMLSSLVLFLFVVSLDQTVQTKNYNFFFSKNNEERKGLAQ